MHNASNTIAKNTIYAVKNGGYPMRVKSLEKIRKTASLTQYRMAEMLGISQINYQQIVSGKIKGPSSRVAVAALRVARDYAKMPLDAALELLSADLGITAEVLQGRYKDNKKHKGMAKK